MMNNTRHLPENFGRCRLEKIILRHFPYNLNVRSSWIALIQDGGQNHEKADFEKKFVLSLYTSYSDNPSLKIIMFSFILKS